MSKEEVETVRYVFKGKYYFSEDCTLDSLVRIDDEIYDCDKCVLLDTINTVRIMCPLTMKKRNKSTEVNISNISNNSGMFLK